VYYTYLGLFPLLHSTPPLTTYLSFPRLGSGLSENVELKNYAFWAARDGDYDHPLTIPYVLRVNQLEDARQSVQVDLTLSAAKPAGHVMQ
jgi:hypothetical protein